MPHKDTEHPGREVHESDEPRHGSDSAGPNTVATTDPAIETVARHQGDWKAQPGSTLRVETTQAGEPSPLYAQGVRTVVDDQSCGRDQNDDDRRERDRDRNDRGEKHSGRQQGEGHGGRNEPSGKHARSQPDEKDRDRGDRAEQDHDHDRGDRPGRQQGPSTMRNLLVTAGVALICGVIGAMGYSYFFESKDDKSGDSSQEKKASSSSKSGGGGNSKNSGKESNAPSTSSAIPGFTSSDDAETLKKQIMDLMQRVDRLGERVDRMTRPKEETPPVLRTMQIKMGELAREMDEVSSLPARLRHDENRLETLQEDIRAIRVRLESMPGAAATATARMSPGLNLSPGSTASGPSGDSRDPGNPTMDLGISLLERGQFASAREVFLRLQVAQPDDARVWYLSALAEGLTKDDWTGEARRLADRGLECERAGHPDAARIDTALATTTPIKGQDWLASLRRRVLGAGAGAGAGGK